MPEDHDLSKFESAIDDLTEFLQNDALKQQESRYNLTKLAICDGEIIGYVSLLTDALKLKVIREDLDKEKIKDELNISNNGVLPAIKIGRFSLDKKYVGKGLGSFILLNVIDNINDLSKNTVGLRYIIVDGYATAYNFYTQHIGFNNLKKDDGFVENIDFIIKRDPKRTFLLYLDLKNIV